MSTTSKVELLNELSVKAQLLKQEIAKVVVGQDLVVDQIINCIFSNGHALLVGVPGLAKTLLVNTVAESLGLTFNRIQFTPDLMPSDITGSEILNQARELEFLKGPIFANIVLADEINRTPPKTQAALLEAMQEKKVTYGGQTFDLEKPFFVLATQNPIDQEGTYALPEAQLDRFMFNIWVDYPDFKDEVEVIKRTTGNTHLEVKQVITTQEIIAFQDVIREMPVADNVIEYAVKVVGKTRVGKSTADDNIKKYLSWGAGPRASQYLIIAAKTNAALNGKLSPDIEDVKKVVYPILRHRVMLNYKAESDKVSLESIIEGLLQV
jgi:MoxR-like ATPase